MHNRFAPRNPLLPEGRRNPSPALAEAIRNGRLEIVERRTGNLINHRISIGNMARWGRGLAMRSWGYHETVDALGSFRKYEARMRLFADPEHRW